MKNYPIFTSLLVVLFFNYSIFAAPSVKEISFAQISSPVTSDINAVTWLNSTTCMAVTSDGKILRSEDAGLTWSATESGTTKSLNDINFLDENNGLIAGGDDNFSVNNTTCFRTTNGGLNWSEVSTTYHYEPLYSVDFSNKAVGESLFRLNDGDQNAFASGAAGLLYLVVAAAIFLGSPFGYVDLNIPGISDNPLLFVIFFGILGFITGGGGTVAKSNNNGDSFSKKTSGTNQQLNSGGSSGLNSSALYKSGINEFGSRVLYKTTGTSSVESIALVGNAGTFIGSIDEGETWTAYTSGTSENINGMTTYGFNEDTQFWYVTDNGGIFMKAGLDADVQNYSISTSYLFKTTLAGPDFNDIAISDLGVAIVVGDDGVIYRSQLEVGAAPPLAPTELTGEYLPGPPVDVVELNWLDNSNNEDGFYIWKQAPSGLVSVLIDSVEANETTYKDSSITESGTYSYLVSAYNGEGQTVITTPFEISIDLTGIDETPLPTGYQLNQNYPNPFNPTTVISFNIARSSHVTLEVYDIMGNKVSTPLNERLIAGSHSISFDAGELTSGIYFYRLITPEYQSTQKMNLIK